MVEVFDFQKNFITGKEIRKSKFKDNSKAKGVATIELFDKDNNLVEKTVSNNFITNPIHAGLYYKDISKNLGNYSVYNDTALYRFNQIQLRSGDFEEDPNNYFVGGTLVGWCPRTSTDAGTSTTRGTYNTTESFTEFTEDGYYHCHMVYDFNTSQGNGEINHVYWHTNNYKGSTSPLYVTQMPRYRSENFSDDLYFDAKGNLLTLKNEKYYKVQNEAMVLNGAADAKYNELEPVEYIPCKHRIDKSQYVTVTSSYKSSSTPSAIECDINLELRNSENDEIIKTKNINMSDFESLRAKFKSGYSSSVYYSDHVCTSDGKVYIAVYVWSSAKCLPFVDSEGNSTENSYQTLTYTICYNILTDEWVIRMDPNNYFCYYFNSSYGKNVVASCPAVDGCTIFFTSSALYYLYPETLKTSSWPAGYLSGDKDTYHAFFERGIDFDRMISIGRYTQGGGGYRCYRLLPYSAHTKLPSPVVKTNTTTMKVTYDYYIQVPNLLAEEGKEFSWE